MENMSQVLSDLVADKNKSLNDAKQAYPERANNSSLLAQTLSGLKLAR